MKASILIAATAAALITATAANADEYSERQRIAASFAADSYRAGLDRYYDEGDRNAARMDAEVRALVNYSMAQTRNGDRMQKRMALARSRSALLEKAAGEGRPLTRAEQASLKTMTKELVAIDSTLDLPTLERLTAIELSYASGSFYSTNRSYLIDVPNLPTTRER